MKEISLVSHQLSQSLDILESASSHLSLSQLNAFFSDVNPQKLLALEPSVYPRLEKIVARYGKKWGMIEPLVLALEEAGQNQPHFKKLAIWARFLNGHISAEDSEFKKQFAPYFHLQPAQCLLIVKDLMRLEHWDEAFIYLSRCCELSEDFIELSKASKLLKEIRRRSPKSILARNKIKVAVLGGMTTMYLVSILDACAMARGIDLEIYEAEYNTIDLEIHNSSSGLFAFRPDVVLLLPIEQHLITEGEDAIEKEVARWRALWSSIETGLKAKVIHLLYDDGAREGSLFFLRNSPQARRHRVHRINAGLVQAGNLNTSFIDYEGLIGYHGRINWQDEKYWALAKQPVNNLFLPRFARHIIATLCVSFGRSKRCIAVDLDNTLWGGVVGEEGVNGVKAGQGDGESEGFLAFQKYLLSLTELGCVLVAVSKNDESLAKECFEIRKDDFALRWSDFAATRINWLDKSENLKSLSEELSLPLEHFVFIDDNPSERNRVRQVLPEVAVPELPLDPSGYIKEIDRQLLFETLALTNEDKLRQSSYKANAERKGLESHFGSLGDFLESLDMVLEVKKLDQSVLERAAQLVGKTNQFNLTTRRYSPAELQQMADNEAYFPVCYRLVDRFGDYGWISLVISKVENKTLIVDTWLMSCRVLGKTVEETVLEDLIRVAKKYNCSKIKGIYIPTKKNGIVSQLFDRLGFTKGDVEGEYWFDLTNESKSQTSYIRRKNLDLS
jgi:FkbH-like protein